MRGKIIYFDGISGRGLIAADDQKLSFEIAEWRSDIPPLANQVVEMSVAFGVLEAVFLVPDEALSREEAILLAGQIVTADGDSVESTRESAPPPDRVAVAENRWCSFGKPLLIAYGVFVVSTLLLPYSSIELRGLDARSFTLVQLPEAIEVMGTVVGSEALSWLAILSLGLPVFWRHRFAWLALLLPLFATIKPGIDLMHASQKASEYSASESFEARLRRQIFEQIIDMLHIGIGVWVCVASALVIAGIGLKRVLSAPTR